MLNSNTLHSRYDPGASASGIYYGYINQGSAFTQNPADTDSVFSIRKQYYVGNVQYNVWSNVAMGMFESSWTNRAACFAAPSNINVTGASSYDGSKWNITFTWNSSTGSSRYLANISYNNGMPITYLADAVSSAVLNPERKSTTLTFVNQNSCTLQNCARGYTYIMNITPNNGYGSGAFVTASVTI
jgi:hypothetical protein